MQHDPARTDGDSLSFPQPELEDPDGRSPRFLDVETEHPSLRVNRRVLRQAMLHALAAEGLRHREVTLALVDAAEMRRLNREYHAADEATDHLGFQYEAPEGEVSGDIFVCPEVCFEQAAGFGETPRRELLRVVVHGILHLAGWPDHSPAARRKVRAREDQLLTELAARPALAAWLAGGAHGR